MGRLAYLWAAGAAAVLVGSGCALRHRGALPPHPLPRRAARVIAGRSSALVAGRRSCTIRGTPADDRIEGTPASDVICGFAGRDVIFGRGGDDVVRGGAGRDELHGDRGDDVLVAGTGGFELLRGGHGQDRVDARDGRPFDRVDGGPGVNLCVADSGDRRQACDHPLVASHRAAIPILMYHLIERNHGEPNPQLYVPPRQFAAQMMFLARHGYHVITLQEAYDYWHGAPLPPKPVVVSFDDGFLNQYTKAMPILARHGWSGTLNLAVSHLSEGSFGLGARRVRTMIRRGWEVDAHSMTHPNLTLLGAAALRFQVAGSRAHLRRLFGVPVQFFCYPSGAFNSGVIAAVRRAGYRLATTTIEGFARVQEPFTLARVRVLPTDGVSGLVAKLAGG